jgi:hypothetical protein
MLAQLRDPVVLRRMFAERPELEARLGPVEAIIAGLDGETAEPLSPHRDPLAGSLATSKPKRLRRNSLPHVPKNRPSPHPDEIRAALAVHDEGLVRLGPVDYPEARRIARAALDATQDARAAARRAALGAEPDEINRVPNRAATERAGGVNESTVRNAVKALVWNTPDVWEKPFGEPARPQFREYLDTPHDRRFRAACEARATNPPARTLTPEQEALDKLSIEELDAMLLALPRQKT